MRNLFTLTRALPLLLLGAAIFCFDMFSSTASGIGKSYQGPEPGTIEVDDYRVSGPFTHQNLSLFLIRGRDELPRGQKVLTLDEALPKKKIKVRETSDVNELIFVNVSGDCTIFIMSGDIVKGGKQDRTIKFDVILGPRSGEVSIAVHCVEAGRWSGRGDESVVEFSSSSKMLATKKAKIGNRASDPHGGGQSEVWDSVAEAQEKLGASLEKDVRATASASSYQLTLEDKDVAAGIEDYERALARIVDRKSDVIGYVFAINGEINSADVFVVRAPNSTHRRNRLPIASAV